MLKDLRGFLAGALHATNTAAVSLEGRSCYNGVVPVFIKIRLPKERCMVQKSATPPVVHSVSTWQEIKFSRPIVGWRELAFYIAGKNRAPHLTPNALRLAFWAGRIPFRAVRHGQKMIFDRKSADAFVRGGTTPL